MKGDTLICFDNLGVERLLQKKATIESQERYLNHFKSLRQKDSILIESQKNTIVRKDIEIANKDIMIGFLKEHKQVVSDEIERLQNQNKWYKTKEQIGGGTLIAILIFTTIKSLSQ